MPPAIRILIIADNLLARAGLAALLGGRGDCFVVGQTAASDTLLEDIELYQPDIILYDLGWNLAHSQRTLTILAKADLPVLALAGDDRDSAAVMRSLSAVPAYGLLLNQTEPELLIQSLQLVTSGLLVLDPAFSAVLAAPAPVENLPEELTARELEVLQLLAQGMTNKAIAHHLGITDHTVKFHVNAIMTKLAAQSRTDAVVRATRAGLLLL